MIGFWLLDDFNEVFGFMCDQLILVYRDPTSCVSKKGFGRDELHLNNGGLQQLMTFIFTDSGMEHLMSFDVRS